MKFPTLYNLDTKNKVRIWYMEQNEDSHHTVSGLLDGKKVTSGWKKVKPTNEGKTNARDGVAQATAEILAQYEKKKDRNWSEEIPSVETFESKYFKPVLAASYKDVAKDLVFPVYSQPKLDGLRCIATREGLWSRNGKQYVSCPHIEELLKPVFEKNPRFVLDGELYNHELKEDFNEITSLVKKLKPEEEHFEKTKDMVQYHIYDVLDLEYPEDVFADRLVLLDADVMWDFTPDSPIQKVSTFLCFNQETIDGLYAAYLENGYEGQIIRLDKKYENKRSKSLLKRKEFLDDEFKIKDIVEGEGNWAGYAKSINCWLPDGRDFSAGIRGNQAYLVEVLKNKDQYIDKLATVRFQNYTPDGKPRFGVVTELDVKDKS